MAAPLTIRDIADRLNALGLRVPTDPGPEVVLPPNPQPAQVRATGGRLIAKSKVALRVAGGEIGVIARQMHALAQKTDPAGAPQIACGPRPTNGTILQFRDGAGWRQRIMEEDAFYPEFLDRLAVVMNEEGWPWRFVQSAATPGDDGFTERWLLVPAATVAPLSELTFIQGGNPPEATPRGGDVQAAPALASLRSPQEVIGAEHYLCGDMECVDGAADYRELVTDLAGLTDGHMKPEEITCVERAGKRHLTIVCAGRKYQALLQGDTDWADVPPLLVCLNEILTEARAPGRLYEQFAPTGGQEFAVAYATPGQVRALETEGCQLLHAEEKKQR